MPTITTTKLPSANTIKSEGFYTWVGAGNMYLIDGLVSSITANISLGAQDIQIRTWNSFDFSIPTSATIDSIKAIAFMRHTSKNDIISPFINLTAIGYDSATTLIDTSATVLTIVEKTFLFSGGNPPPTVAEINTNGFGFTLTFFDVTSVGNPETYEFDYIQLEITYTVAQILFPTGTGKVTTYGSTASTSTYVSTGKTSTYKSDALLSNYISSGKTTTYKVSIDS